jgi:hypothetical protein
VSPDEIAGQHFIIDDPTMSAEESRALLTAGRMTRTVTPGDDWRGQLQDAIDSGARTINFAPGEFKLDLGVRPQAPTSKLERRISRRAQRELRRRQSQRERESMRRS